MRIALVFLALIYIFIRIIFVDRYEGRYFIIDYFEAVDFVSSFNYNPSSFVQKNILPYFNSVAIKLKSLNELKSEGKVDVGDLKSLETNPKFWALPLINQDFSDNVSFVYCPNEIYLNKIEEVVKALKLKYQRIGNVLVVYADSNYFFNLQVFFVENVNFKDKKIFWRVSSYVYDLDYLKVYCKEGDFVFFVGPFVAGYPDYLDEIKKFLKDNNLYFAFPEFYDAKNVQLGSSKLVDFNSVKIFSTAVLRNKDIKQVINSIDLAINERNCRAVMFRFFDRYSLKENIEAIKDIYDVYMNKNSNFNKGNVSRNLVILNILDVIFVLFLSVFVFLSYSYYYDLISNNGYSVNGFWFALLGLVNSFSILLGKFVGIDLVFNLAVVIGSSFVLVSIFFKVFDSSKNMYVKYFEIILYSVSLGAILNLLFFENSYVLAVEKVRFIKLLLLLPIVLSVFCVFSYNQIVLFFYRRIRVMDLALFLFILGSIGFYLLRSGNSGFVLPLEDKIRVLLDKILVARPRFKEFIIGNPSILFSNYSKYFIPLSFISMAGIVDSFLHIHTPIFYSLLRTFWGALLGILVFILIAKLWKVELDKKDK